MNVELTPERRRFSLQVRPGLSEELERLRREGWVIERLRLHHGSGSLEVTAVRHRLPGDERQKGSA